MKVIHSKGLKPLVPVVLLLLQIFLRTHHIDIQNPYVDEGFHIRRAGFILDFEMHPARVSHGKLLIYFWLGLFETDRLHVLIPSRLSMSLLSMVTGAALYAIGKKLHSHTAGLLALILYIFCPIALFYERMAMADPLASMLATLLVWRSLILVKHPTLFQGAVAGILVGLAAMAKLTMGLTPAIPMIAALIYYPWKRQDIFSQFNEWMKIYTLPFVAAAIATLLLWLPILIPAALARNTDEPFKLVNAYNLRSNADEDNERFTPLEYIEEVRTEMDDFFTENLLLFIAGIFALAVLIQPRELRNYLFILLWFLVIVLPSLVGARLATSRYFMPMSAPLMFALAYVIASLFTSPPQPAFASVNGEWAKQRPPRLRLRGGQKYHAGVATDSIYAVPTDELSIGTRYIASVKPLTRVWGEVKKVISLIAAAGAVIWLVTHAIPFAQTDLTDPDKINFRETNYTEYQSGFLIANDAERDAAKVINEINPEYVVASWNLCHYLYFYTEKEVPCLRLDYVRQDLAAFVESLPEGEKGYLILSGYRPFFQEMAGIGWEEVTRFKQEKIRNPNWDVQIWRVWKQN